MVASLIINNQLPALGRVGILYGGNSSEREISLMSGEAVYRALKNVDLEAVLIDVEDDLLKLLPTLELDQIFIALHGPGGEDGTLQGALEYLQLPYTGSGVLASSLAMDKRRCKQLWQGIQLPTADFCLLEKNTDWASVLHCLGNKAMVKPANEGSSIGMSRVETASELEMAWKFANDFDAVVIAEPLLSGDEYTVAILGDEVLPSIRIETSEIFYDYQAKYFSDETEYFCPSGLSKKREGELSDLAMKAFKSLGCSGWGRVDVMTDDKGRFQLLEVNTVPGLTSHSLVPMAAKAAGIDFEHLVLEILRNSL
jgi:D-alanine-D-alanine ligase